MARRAVGRDSSIGIWRLDSDVGGLLNVAKLATNDLSNSGTTSESVSGMPWSHARRFSKATRDYLYVADHADLNFATANSMSFFCWIKPSSWDSSGSCFVWKIDATGGYSFRYDNAAGQLIVATKTSGVTTERTYTVPLSLDQWHHIGFSIYESVAYRIYADGEASSIQTTVTLGDSTSTLYLGRDDTDAKDFDGLMADVLLSSSYIPANVPHFLYNAPDDVVFYEVEE